MPFEIDPSYNDVAARIADLKALHPNARLRPVNELKPYTIETIGDKTFIVYTAACYRDADDELPGIGVAWEPFPGTTPYTKNSEVMNAETSAWGRAIIAALASESKTIASAEEVRNRSAEVPTETKASTPKATPRTNSRSANPAEPITDKQQSFLNRLMNETGLDIYDLHVREVISREVVTPPDLSKGEAKAAIDYLIGVRDGTNPAAGQPERREVSAAPSEDDAARMAAAQFDLEAPDDELDRPF